MTLKKEQDGWTLKKPEGRDFCILVLTDTHIGAGMFSKKADKKTIAGITDVVARANADLIILLGDIIHPLFSFSGTRDNQKQAKLLGSLLDGFGIPWAFVFGNHDSEAGAKLGREELAAVFMEHKHCLFMKGPENIRGVGNYVLKINNVDDTLNHVLFLMDSNEYFGKGFFSGVDHIYDCQADWYSGTTKKINQENGRKVPSMLFFHKPLQEFKQAYELYEAGSERVQYHYGGIGEPFSVSKMPTKIFEKVIEEGCTKAIFVGHDHASDLSLTYKGVRQTYALSMDHLAYIGAMRKKVIRGGTVIRIADNGTFDINQVPYGT